MLVEKAASLHMSLEEMTKKNQKYKKQLVYMQDEQQKKIENLKEQRVNDEMEIIKYKSLLEEKQKFLDKLLEKDMKDSKDIRMFVQESYQKITDYEKSIIEQDHERKLAQQKEETEKELEERKSIITELEQKYSNAKHKIHELKNEVIKMQQKKSATESKKFKDEKAIIIKNLNEKNKKIEKLEKEIENWKIKYDGLEKFLGEDQKVAYSKLQTLTKNMNQLKQLYSQIVSAESVKQEKHVLEKKLKRKERKIEHIENELSTTREQVVNLKNQVHMLYTELKQYTKVEEGGIKMLVSNIDKTISPEALQQNKGIVKSRKGGKGKKNSNSLSFSQLMQLSSLNKDNDTGEIVEQDEDEERSWNSEEEEKVES
jgi:chromosome segregation ATPase